MANSQVKIDVRRGRRESGQTIIATALTPSGRILGSVEVIISLMPGFSVAERVGQEGEDQILQHAEELAGLVAEAVLTEPRAAKAS